MACLISFGIIQHERRRGQPPGLKKMWKSNIMARLPCRVCVCIINRTATKYANKSKGQIYMSHVRRRALLPDDKAGDIRNGKIATVYVCICI